MSAQVINLRDAPADWRQDARYLYIGRAMPRQRLVASAFANPFKIGRDGDRDEVLAKYAAWLRQQPELVDLARRTLPGRVLVCWCAPLPCHGDTLVELLREVQK